MNHRYILLLFFILLSFSSFSQMYILNEDFSGTSGTTPPNGWSNVILSGGASDQWHFDNPGQRILNYPVLEPFAIFDSEAISGNGQPEEVALETPLFDASVSNYILLSFHHTLEPGTGGEAKIMVYDGTDWQQMASFTTATQNPQAEVVDLSPAAGGITNARLRLVWSGNGSGYWAVDNLRIYASQPLDGGVVSIDSPTSPVNPGVLDVEITLGNFGYNTITTTTVEWTANGVPQTPFAWNGSLGFGQTISNVAIGTYNFQVPVLLKVWQTNPNGGSDPNPFNDTITKYVESALCGTYTIGGTDPDFTDLASVASTLNSAGITCPVTFMVRDGIYLEHFILGDIPGTSDVNTVTFISESGNNTDAVIKIIPEALKYEPMIYMDGTHNVYFHDLGFSTGSQVSYANTAVIMDGAADIEFDGCFFDVRNQSDYALDIHGGSNSINVLNSRFDTYSQRARAIIISDDLTEEIEISGNDFSGPLDYNYNTIEIEDGTHNVNIENNDIDLCFRAIRMSAVEDIYIHNNNITNSSEGVYMDNGCNQIEISANRMLNISSHQNVPDGTYGVYAKNSEELMVFNNFIHTMGDGVTRAIILLDMSSSQVVFNSVNTTNIDAQGRSTGLYIEESNAIVTKNNIFNIENKGLPVILDGSTSSYDFDRNDYYMAELIIGSYNDEVYFSLDEWVLATGNDQNSFLIPPFYTSQTDLSMNQAVLNNAGSPVPGITSDIDGTPRDPVNPDVGAKEYDPCAIDAGINQVVNPTNPLSTGNEPVTVLLQNQGNASLTSVIVNWSVNEQPQPAFDWSGNLVAGSSTEVTVGNYNFMAGGTFIIRSWTSDPNNTADCNPLNDTIESIELAAPLCGTYTIGGTAPDFESFEEATAILNVAGVTCPVTFLVRDGIYREQLNIKEISGTSSTNRVSFISESGDSTKAILQIPEYAQKYETLLYMEGSEYVSFRQLGIFTGSAVGFFNDAVNLDNAGNIEFDRCYFSIQEESDMALRIGSGSHHLSIQNSYIECIQPRSLAMDISGLGTGFIDITDNYISGATDYNQNTIRIYDNAGQVALTGNYIENCFTAISATSTYNLQIGNNIFSNINYGIYADAFSSEVDIFSNRFQNVVNHPQTPGGTSPVFVRNADSVRVYNNFIQTGGAGPVKAINIQSSSKCRIFYNSLNIKNIDPQANCIGLLVNNSGMVTALNNICYISTSGMPVLLQGNNTELVVDHNDYFSFDRTIGSYNGEKIYDLAEWRSTTGMDQNSVSARPFYSSDTDLSINQILLNDAGTAVPGIAVDIDGAARDPLAPDMGAREYDPCSVDAGINDLVSPQSPLAGGEDDVIVELINQGTTTLTAARINWSVNEEVQTSFDWTGNLASAQMTEVNIGTYDFQIGRIFNLEVWTSDPNNSTDCNLKNDTIRNDHLASPLCGDYTIGGDNPDFISITEAVTVLNQAGIACAVTFMVRDGVYIEQFVLEPVPGSSAENTVSFVSESQDSSLVEIRISLDALNNEPMIYLKGAQNIFFEDLGFYTGGQSSEGNAAFLLDGAKNIRIQGCYVEPRKESDLAFDVMAGSQDIVIQDNFIKCIHFNSGGMILSDVNTRDITVTGNHFRGNPARGYTMVRIENYVSNVDFQYNSIEQCFTAVFVVKSDSIFIRNNKIRNVHAGIFIDNDCSNVDIYANRIFEVYSQQNVPEGTVGIFIRNISNIEVVNNFVHTTGLGPSKAITLQGIDTCKFYFNSLNVTNTDPQGKSRGLVIENIGQLHGRDNILCVKELGIPMEIGSGIEEISLDYNDYYQSTGIIGEYEGNTYYSLSNWGQTLNGDANSMNLNPFFKADTVPLPFQRTLNGAGIPIPGIEYDIDGKQRFSQAPDVGCLEFFVDYGVLELLSPSLNCFHPDVDSVIVLIKQYGDVPFDDLKVAYQMNDGAIHSDTIPGPLLEDVIHNFNETENLTTYGDYLFKIWLINTLDDNINNDTLYAWRYSKPSPEPTFTYDNFCTGPKIYFFGEATVPDPYIIDGYEWLFGDGETSTEQNPVHTFQSPGTYEVEFRAYSDAGCYGEVILPVYIDPEFDPLTLDYNVVNETCLNDGTGSIEILPTGGFPPVTISLNGEPVSDTMITGLTTGQYILEAIDSENCSVVDTVNITSLIFMNPHIIADPLSGNSPLTVQFDFTAEGYADWLWHFTDQDTDTSHSPTYTFTEYGNHVVLLEVISGHPHYCVEATTVEIFVKDTVIIEANNVFTPNNDGVNDYFEFTTSGIRSMEAKIYNIWGNKVYTIEELNGRWDGSTSGGAKAPDGTYLWSLAAEGSDNQIYAREGSVLLLRHAAQAIPNPVRDNVRVKVFDQLDPPVEVKVFSAYGQLVHAGSVNDAENIVLNLSALPGGIYFIKVTDGRGNYLVRIIKN